MLVADDTQEIMKDNKKLILHIAVKLKTKS